MEGLAPSRVSFAIWKGREQRGQSVVRIIRAAMGYAAIPAGFPILVSERMAIIEPAFAWLMELATIPGRSHAAETVRTYGEHLHDWFDSLEQSELDWHSVSEAEIAAWRNRMLSQPSLHTKRPYARSTVNDRVRTVCRFYAWAQGDRKSTRLNSSQPDHLVCRLLLEKKKKKQRQHANLQNNQTQTNKTTKKKN